MIKKLTVAIVVIMIASLSVAGCVSINTNTASPTSSPTPTPTANIEVHQSTPIPSPSDKAAALTKSWEAGAAVAERPFSKSTNFRGNEVYIGVFRNATLPGAKPVTITIEFARSEAQAKSVYDSQVAAKQQQGYVLNPDAVTYYKGGVARFSKEAWAGALYPNYFLCFYDSQVNGQGTWNVVIETWSS
ncbi:MAG: hypothetical protein ACXVIG_01315 [Halobacteriota archaeon]